MDFKIMSRSRVLKKWMLMKIVQLNQKYCFKIYFIVFSISFLFQEERFVESRNLKRWIWLKRERERDKAANKIQGLDIPDMNEYMN